MSEIEKMYENAEIKLDCCKYAEYGYEGEEGIWYYCIKEDKECWTYPNGSAGCVEKDYPPFTSEKQLNLIKWLITNGHCYFTVSIEPREFTEYLARYVNKVWQDLIDTEKSEIKDILK